MPGDTVVISATPIPGNENAGLPHRSINLFRRGADVLYNRSPSVHVRGHASPGRAEDLSRPASSRSTSCRSTASTATWCCTPSWPWPWVWHRTTPSSWSTATCSMLEGGRVVGHAPASYVYVDGVSVGDINGVVLRNRKMLSQDGIVVAIVTLDAATGHLAVRPDIVSRGFVDPEAGRALLEESKDIVSRLFEEEKQRISDSTVINTRVRDLLAKFITYKTRRRPMVLPVIVTV